MFQVLAPVHVAIAVSDLEQQLAFWQQVMGFTLQGTTTVSGPLPEQETGVANFSSRLAMLALGSLTLELYQPLTPASRQTYRPTPADVGSWHLALRVTGLDELLEVCARWGWQVRGQVTTVTEGPGPVGARLVYLHNVDGTILELVELPQKEGKYEPT